MMGVVRINITLPEDLVEDLNASVSPRKKSRFIADALRQRLAHIRREALEKKLEEGYKAVSKGNKALAKEFEAVDMEGWDEY